MGRDCASEIGPSVLAEGRPEDLRAKASAEIGVAPKPSSSGVTSQCKSRVTSHRKSTNRPVDRQARRTALGARVDPREDSLKRRT